MNHVIKQTRPYAQAAFNYACEQKALSKWSTMLEHLVEIVNQPLIKKLLAHPQPSTAELADICITLAGEKLDKSGKNFVKILAKNRRLPMLPDIVRIFSELRADSEKKVTVEIVSATPLTDTLQTKLKQTLSKKLHRDAELHCNIDGNIVGGLIIKSDGTVIDHSVMGQLSRLQAKLIG